MVLLDAGCKLCSGRCHRRSWRAGRALLLWAVGLGGRCPTRQRARGLLLLARRNSLSSRWKDVVAYAWHESLMLLGLAVAEIGKHHLTRWRRKRSLPARQPRYRCCGERRPHLQPCCRLRHAGGETSFHGGVALLRCELELLGPSGKSVLMKSARRTGIRLAMKDHTSAKSALCCSTRERMAELSCEMRRPERRWLIILGMVARLVPRAHSGHERWKLRARAHILDVADLRRRLASTLMASQRGSTHACRESCKAALSH